MASYDPGNSSGSSDTEKLEQASEAGSDNLADDWVDEDDPLFQYPFMGGSSPVHEEEPVAEEDERREGQTPSPASMIDQAWGRSQRPNIAKDWDSRQGSPDARQYHRDQGHFGGDYCPGAVDTWHDEQAATLRRGGLFEAVPTPQTYWDARDSRMNDGGHRNGARVGEEWQQRSTPGSHQPNAKLGKFNAPAPFQYDIKQSEKYERWLKWKTTFDIALSICDGVPSDRQKTGLLYTYVGDDVRDIIGMLSLPPMHNGRPCREGEYTELSKGLNRYFRTLVDATTDYARFTARKQLPNESVHQFAIKLRDLGLRVEVAHESIGFRHQFMSGLANRTLAKKATEEGLSIGGVIQQAGRMEQAAEAESNRQWAEPSFHQATVAAMSAKKEWTKSQPSRGSKRSFSGRDASSSRKQKQCGKCARRPHEEGQTCPAVGKSCLNCGGENHFAAVCSKKTGVNVIGGSRKTEQGAESEHDTYTKICEINGDDTEHLVKCTVGHSPPIEFLIDSGSDWNLVSTKHWKELRNARRSGNVVLYGVTEKPGAYANAYGSVKPLEAVRCFHAWIEVPESSKPRNFAKFYVVENGAKSILGRDTSKRMELLQVGVLVRPQVNELSTQQPTEEQEESVGEGDECYDKGRSEPSGPDESTDEFPSIPNYIFDFDIDVDVAPSVKAYVNIPEAYRERAIERLRKMEAQNIIEKVSSAPRWISGLSAVPKGKDDFRLVVNMVGPNRAIRRRFYKMPTLEFIRTKLAGAKYFTKLDLTSAFHHIKLGEKSKELTTFLGPDGMYRFLRLNFGVSSAPEGFQQKMDEIMQGLHNVLVYVDDILIYASDLTTLRLYTKRVLEALKANNLTLNKDKCEYERESLEFLGHELSADGFNISKKKVEDVEKFRTPQNTTELKSFLGLASFLAAYIKNFSDLTKPLWDATVSGQFTWGSEQEASFCAVKREIVKCTVKQGFFSGTDDTFLYTDASPVALGAVLVQRNQSGEFRTIAFASRLLSPTERRYPQTQREALGIVWGSEHFWYYLLGRRFTVRTDAQGISFILKRDHTQTKRIMRRSDAWALRMEAFDYLVEYVRGEQNIADSSSRLVEGIGEENFEDGPTPGEIMCFTLDTPGDITFKGGRVTMEEVKWHTERDVVIKAVIEALESDQWPRSIGKYRSVKHELRVKDGLLTRMGETVVPEELRPKVLSTAHAGHPGVGAMKSILRGSVWWPGILTHAENWVLSCKACALMSRRGPPMPMQRSELPAAVWECIAMDFNGPYRQYGDVYILLVVCLYSRFLIARPVKSTNFGAIRGVMDDIFDTYGNVKSCKTDNGPPFFGEEYKDFLDAHGTAAVFSTPLDAQQNGGVETYMRLVNKGMVAATVDGGSWRKSLADTMAAHNAAVCPTTRVAPEVLMFGRKIRRNLPLISTEVEKPMDAVVRRHDWGEKLKMKELVDKKRSAQYSKVQVGDKVFVSRQNKLKGQSNFDPTEFTVISKNHGTLELLSPLGNLLSRTITFVKKVPDRRVTGVPEIDRQADRPAQRVEDGEGGFSEATEGTTLPLRRSERTKKSPANLKDFVYLLGWK